MYRAYQHIRDVLGAYRCMGHTGGVKMYVGVQMYRDHTDVQGAYRCIGVDRCMGSVQIYEAIQAYGGMYGGIQAYRGHIDV